MAATGKTGGGDEPSVRHRLDHVSTPRAEPVGEVPGDPGRSGHPVGLGLGRKHVKRRGEGGRGEVGAGAVRWDASSPCRTARPTKTSPFRLPSTPEPVNSAYGDDDGDDDEAHAERARAARHIERTLARLGRVERADPELFARVQHHYILALYELGDADHDPLVYGPGAYSGLSYSPPPGR